MSDHIERLKKLLEQFAPSIEKGKRETLIRSVYFGALSDRIAIHVPANWDEARGLANMMAANWVSVITDALEDDRIDPSCSASLPLGDNLVPDSCHLHYLTYGCEDHGFTHNETMGIFHQVWNRIKNEQISVILSPEIYIDFYQGLWMVHRKEADFD